MGHLYRLNLKRIVRVRMEMFWGLFFPLLLGTLFYFSFGAGTAVDLEKMDAIPVAVVGGENQSFLAFLTELDQSTLEISRLEEEEALEALKDGTVTGIYYAEEEPALTVSSSNLKSSILVSLVNGYREHTALLEKIAAEHPLNMLRVLGSANGYAEMVEEVNLSGKSLDGNANYFYALMAMACLFGAFQGMAGAQGLRANLSSLAVRRSVSPVHRMKMIAAEVLSIFTVQFACVCIVLAYLALALRVPFGANLPAMIPVCALGSMTGVAYGIFIGSSRMPEGLKIGILVLSSLLMCFLSGLMYGNMKDIVEKHMPILNRINPAALISDAFYSLSIYDNPARYRMNLLILAGITMVLVTASFLVLRRERYDSL